MTAKPIDEIALLNSVTTTLNACKITLSSLNRSDFERDYDSDSDNDARDSRPAYRKKPVMSEGMKKASSAAHRKKSAQQRNQRAMETEMASNPVDPRQPPPMYNVQKLRTAYELEEAQRVVAAACERNTPDAAERMRKSRASARDKLDIVMSAIEECEQSLTRLSELNRLSYHHFAQRTLAELVNCDQRSTALGSPGFANPAAVPDESLGAGTKRGAVVTGDGSDFDNSNPTSPRSPRTPGSSTDDESGSPYSPASAMLDAAGRGHGSRPYDGSLGPESDLDV